MHLSISFQALGNARCTMLKVGYSERVTRCVCWSDFRMRYAVVTSGWKTAIVGVIRAKTSSGEEWQAQRVPVCRALGHPTNGSKASVQLAARLDETRKTVASRFDRNTAVDICNEGKHPSLTISSPINWMSHRR